MIQNLLTTCCEVQFKHSLHSTLSEIPSLAYHRWNDRTETPSVVVQILSLN
ncbi:hypothetical protein [Vibrio sp. WZ-1]|uniref:hypothetical protein n=1 Tax=Vibrio sp. WZ-1 TaxID=3454501 RepID=UPI003F84E9C9